MQLVIQQMLKQGIQAEKKNRPNDAIAIYEKILAKFPNFEEAVTKITNIFITHGEYQNAIKSLQYYLSITKDKHLAYYNIGNMQLTLKDFDAARLAYQNAIDFKPEYLIAYCQLVTSCERLNSINAAEITVNRALLLFPRSGDLNWMVGKFNVKKKNYTEAEKFFIKAQNLGLDSVFLESKFLTEFAKLKEKLKKYDEAMTLFVKAQNIAANNKQKSKINTRKIDLIINTSDRGFSQDELKSWKTPSVAHNNTPIFVIGFPRSGTTLMEQVLFSHPKLIATDELQILPDLSSNISNVLGRKIRYPSGLNTLSEHEILRFRQEYYKQMANSISGYERSLRIVDKNPMSMIYLGFIKRFFPDSPIIMMVRDPRDACLSCFSQWFKLNPTTVNFLKLKSSFDFYVRAMDVYLSLKQKLSLNILEVKYEDMCSDFEGHARKVIEHVGEKWDDSVLEFHKPEHRRIIQTPSFDAVTKPVSQNAVGNWQCYLKDMAPFEHLIEPYLKAFAYQK